MTKLVILSSYYNCSSNNSVWELSNDHFTSKRQWPCTDCFSLFGQWIRTLVRLDIHWIQWYGTTHAHKSDTRQAFAFRTYLFSMKSILLNAAALSFPTIVDLVITFKEAVGFCETFGTCLPSYTALHPNRLWFSYSSTWKLQTSHNCAVRFFIPWLKQWTPPNRRTRRQWHNNMSERWIVWVYKRLYERVVCDMWRRREAGGDAVTGISILFIRSLQRKAAVPPPAISSGDFRVQTGKRYTTLIRKQN